MTPDPGRSSLPAGFVRLSVSMAAHSDADRLLAVLVEERGPLSHGAVELAPADGLRRHLLDLHLRLGGERAGITTFGKAAFLDVGRPRRTADGWELEISWRAATAAPLFPVFSGWLRIDPQQMLIEGIYAPPGGLLGQAADRVLLHVAANATARWLLREIDRVALGAAA